MGDWVRFRSLLKIPFVDTRLRWVAVTALLAPYCVLLAFAGHDDAARSMTAPLAYLALVLGALWWGRKGVVAAGILIAVDIVHYLSMSGIADPWGDLARAASFLVVAFGLGFVRDKAEAALEAGHASERKYRDIVEKSLAGIAVYRKDVIVYVNPRFKVILGLEPQDMVGRPFWEFIAEVDRDMVRRRIEERHPGGQKDLHYECRLLGKDGRVVWADIVSSVVEYESKSAVLVSAYDITERRELSKLARRQEEQLVHSTRLAEMGEMAAGIAHELNQPLTGIKNYAKNAAYMLEEGTGGGEEVQENLRRISGQVDRAARIIGQMRDLARRTERQLGVVNINEKLHEIVEFIMPQLRLSGVEVTFRLAPDLPAVMGDEMRLEQVFLNLLTNARHAMQDGDVRRLSITTRHEPASEWPVVVEIADTGKGFAPEHADKLFTPFFSTKKVGQGTGLGLSISLSIIKDHNGAIEARGEEGRGATFTVRLPDTAARPDHEAGPEELHAP